MALTLIINPGSSSKKYALFQDDTLIASWRFERNEQTYEVCTEYHGEQQKCEGVQIDHYTAALRQVLDAALSNNIINRLQDITQVAVRIVAPGTVFQQHVIINEEFLRLLRSREAAAPLHIPHTVRELDQLTQELPEAVVIGVSDSAFHAALPAVARTYGIAVADAKMHDIYRFGYHGISCASVWRRVPDVLSSTPAKCIIAHIGSGMSLTALKDGKSIDTTMGFSPASGLIMGSRAGSIESGALLELMRSRNLSLYDTQSYLSSQSGLKGLTGEADFRHILERISSADTVAQEALDIVIYNFQKQLGSYAVALGGLDTIVLTATAMERNSDLRSRFLAHLEWFGVELDVAQNEALPRQGGVISVAGSPVQVVVIPTNELDEMRRISTAVVTAAG